MEAKVVVCSRNRKKIVEIERIFRSVLPGADWVFIGAEEAGLPEVEETGSTFLENARIKALFGAKHTGMLCIGEDSGLEVDALGGAPGVKSHRFSPTGADHDNNELLLEKLRGIEMGKRTARYRSAAVLASPEGILAEGEGSVEGLILNYYSGSNGFGYDPLFYSLELGKSFGDASAEEKDSVSHRRRALEALVRNVELAGLFSR